METIKEDLEREKAVRFKNSPDWAWAKEKLELLITGMSTLASLPKGVTATTLQKEIDKRNAAVALVKTWIEYIEGIIESQQINKDKIINNGNELITHFGEE